MPYIKIFFLPFISASFPKGTRNIAAARIYEVATQFNRIASIENSFPIEGSAMLMDEPIKGVRKEPSVAMSRAAVCIYVHSKLMYAGVRFLRVLKNNSKWGIIPKIGHFSGKSGT